MKTRLLLLVSACVLVGSVAIGAEAAKGTKKAAAKTPADLAYADATKVLADKTAKQDQAHFAQIVEAGTKFLVKFPTSTRAPDMVRELAGYPLNYLSDKTTAPQRGVYISALRYQVVSARTEPDVTDDAKIAIAALDAAVADTETRLQPNRPNLEQLRQKIDDLAALPNSGKFLAPREQSYAEILGHVASPAKAESHLRTLVEHPQQPVSDMAKRTLAIVELRKAPLELKFTGLDGKEIDVAQLRGKVTAVYFWSATNPTSTKGLDHIREVYSFNRKAGFEVVTISYDKASDREKLMNYVKDNRMPFPVHFDGNGSKHELGSKLGVTNVPHLILCDRQGMIVSMNLALPQLEPAVKQLLKTK